MFFSDFARAAVWWQLDFSSGSCTDESACLAFASCSSPNLAVADAQRALLLRHILRSHVCDFERQGHALSGCRPAQLPALLNCIGLILMFSAHDFSVPDRSGLMTVRILPLRDSLTGSISAVLGSHHLVCLDQRLDEK